MGKIVIKNADRVDFMNADMFRDLLYADDVKVLNCHVTRNIDFEADNAKEKRQIITLCNEADFVLSQLYFESGKQIDLEKIAHEFVPQILQYTGTLCLILHSFAEKYTYNKEDAETFRKAIVQVATEYLLRGGYYQIDSQCGAIIFDEIFQALKNKRYMLPVKEVYLNDVNAVDLYVGISRRLNDNMRKEVKHD